MFFLTFEGFEGKLPTNKKLSKFGHEPKVCCYNNLFMDTIKHIFISGHFANYIWKRFTASFGIDCQPLPLHHFIMRWWKVDCKNEAHRLFL